MTHTLLLLRLCLEKERTLPRAFKEAFGFPGNWSQQKAMSPRNRISSALRTWANPAGQLWVGPQPVCGLADPCCPHVPRCLCAMLAGFCPPSLSQTANPAGCVTSSRGVSSLPKLSSPPHVYEACVFRAECCPKWMKRVWSHQCNSLVAMCLRAVVQ